MADTPSYSRGKLNDSDEGDTRMAVAVDGDVVIIAFPKPTAWIGLPAESAEELAALLLKRAADARHNRQ